MNKLIMAGEPPSGSAIPLLCADRGWLAVIDFLGIAAGLRRGHARGSEGDRIGRCDSQGPRRREFAVHEMSGLELPSAAPRAKRRYITSREPRLSLLSSFSVVPNDSS